MKIGVLFVFVALLSFSNKNNIQNKKVSTFPLGELGQGLGMGIIADFI